MIILNVSSKLLAYFENVHTSCSFQNLKQFNFSKILIYLIHHLSKIFVLTKLLQCDVPKFPQFSFSWKRS
jgi:hypothetical protein